MSMTPVEFSLVRYSPIEGTHFFYDQRYPSSIQFLLSGRWESWDVGWVKYKAQDPDIRQIAAVAEARLIQDPNSGYNEWPSQPPPGPPPSLVDSASLAEVDADSHARDGSTPPTARTGYPHASAHSNSPNPEPPGGYVIGAPKATPAPLQSHEQRHAPPEIGAYSSPCNHRDPSVSSAPSLQVVTSAPTEAATGSERANDGTTQQTTFTASPPYQPATPTGTVLSRHRETKILLSLDGDGIRGLSMLLLVESLVNAICTKVGQRLDPHQIFDLTGGNSLGGVTGIMLCRLQMQAHRAREAYKQIAKQVFLNKRDFFLSLDPRASTPNVGSEALEEEIKALVKQETGREDELLLDKRDDSGDVFVVATHIRIGSSKAALMRSYQTRRITGPELDANMQIWQAMKATCVAPRYMQPQPGVSQRLVIEPGLVDHGTAKNNPVRDILYECRKLFRYTNDQMIIVSIGTGIGLNRDTEIPEMANSVEDRNAEARIWGEKFEADHQALMERGWMNYFRFNVTGLENVPLEEWRHEDIIKEKTSTYLAQPDVSSRFYACVDAITSLMLGTSQPR